MASHRNDPKHAAHPRNNTRIYIVSACLAGQNCTYSGNNKLSARVRKLVEDGLAVTICPEVTGGSTVPRQRCEIVGGDGAEVLDGRARVMTDAGGDVSAILISGARKAVALAKRHRVKKAILKSKSPSCGCGQIYDGTFTGSLRSGDGVTAAMLRRSGISVYTEVDWDEK